MFYNLKYFIFTKCMSYYKTIIGVYVSVDYFTHTHIHKHKCLCLYAKYVIIHKDTYYFAANSFICIHK